MAKGRKQVKKNKPVPRMTSKDEKLLGKNSHQMQEYYNQALWNRPVPPVKLAHALSVKQVKELIALKKNLKSNIQTDTHR